MQQHQAQSMDLSKIYLITDRKATRNGRFLVDVVDEATAFGVKLVQLREKDLEEKDLISLALNLKNICHKNSAKLLINSNLKLCKTLLLDGVHLPCDKSVKTARDFLGKNALIGYSAHSTKEAITAQKEGADFITLSPIYETASKLKYGKPIGLSTLKDTSLVVKIPIFALGGINKNRINEVIKSGATGVAAISAIISSESPKEAVKEFLNLLK